MTIQPAASAASPSSVPSLLRDHVVQLAAWTLAVEAAVYLVPLLDPAGLAAFGSSRFQIPFLAVVVAAAFHRLNRLDDSGERPFWITIGAAAGCWLLTVAGVTIFPVAGPSPIHDVLEGTGHLLFYGAVLAAAELLPHMPRAQVQSSTGWHLRTAGVLLAATGWFVYFVAAPAGLPPDAGNATLSLALFCLVMDAIAAARFAALAAACESPRWRTLYGALAAALLVRMATDEITALGVMGAVERAPGTMRDLLWASAPLALVAAIRARHLDWRGARFVPNRAEIVRDRAPAQTAALLVACAAGFPVLHVALHAGDMSAPPTLFQHIVALAAMVTVGGVGMVTYRTLERQRVTSERARRALEFRLREAKKMEALARLSSTVTHEYLNLLNAIGGYVDLTLDSIGTDDPAAENLRRAHEVVRRTTAFTKRLLVISRGQPFHALSANLTRTIRDMVPDLRGLMPPPAALDATIAADDGMVAMSASALREIMVQLVTNAGEAMTAGGRAKISASWVYLDAQSAIALAVRPGRYGKVVVADTGTGIPGDVMAHLFEPFFTTKPKPRARGLGLASVYVLVNQHGGCVSVSSELGAGTTVEFLLPEYSGGVA